MDPAQEELDRQRRMSLNQELIKQSIIPDCRECGRGMIQAGNVCDMTFWYCQQCDAVILESQHEFSLLYLTPDEVWT